MIPKSGYRFSDKIMRLDEFSMKPKTLLEMAGATPAPPPLSESTIVVIDAQREYVDGKLPLHQVEPALAEIGKLLARARALRAPVIHIVHQGKAGGAFAPDTPGFEVASQRRPRRGKQWCTRTCPTHLPRPISRAGLPR